MNTMKTKNIFTAIFIFATISLSVEAAPFNKKIKQEEIARLEAGEVLIRNIDSYKDLCINRTAETEKLYKGVFSLKPAYIAEVIKVVPYEGNEDLRERVNTTLLNLPSYVNIPYFSERTQKMYKLYDSAQIKEINKDGADTVVSCELEMSLFGKFDAQIDIEETDSYYYYMLQNLDDLIYHGKFTAVKKHNMQSYITLFRDGDNWILYSAGCVDAPKIFFLKERIETSFMNRIKSFCNFIFTQI